MTGFFPDKMLGVLRSLSLHLFSAAMKKSSSAPKWGGEILSLHRVEDLLTEEHPSIQYKWMVLCQDLVQVKMRNFYPF